MATHCSSSTTDAHTVYLGLGSNLGDRQRLLREAIRLIGLHVGPVERQSAFLETEPWGFSSPHRFVNAAVCCRTQLTPRALLEQTQQIERALGRKRKTAAGYEDRPIDIDVLLYDRLTVDEPDLKIPHPLMFQRDFVMTPLREICPDHLLTQMNKAK